MLPRHFACPVLKTNLLNPWRRAASFLHGLVRTHRVKKMVSELPWAAAPRALTDTRVCKWHAGDISAALGTASLGFCCGFDQSGIIDCIRTCSFR
jgi:hypothetical protein